MQALLALCEGNHDVADEQDYSGQNLGKVTAKRTQPGNTVAVRISYDDAHCDLAQCAGNSCKINKKGPVFTDPLKLKPSPCDQNLKRTTPP
jgi:hypothetical protein